MLKVVLVCTLLLGAVFASDNSLLSQWNRYKSDYSRVYASTQEESFRFRVFQQNLETARQMSAQNPHARFGVTKFMDLTKEEFKQQFLMPALPPVDRELLNRHYHNNATYKTMKAPQSIDWFTQGACTPVYNQGQCGSCWAFSATEQIESMYKLSGQALTQMSMEQIVDCDTTCDGCGGGWTYAAYEYVQSAGGIDSYSSYPYSAGGGYSGQCQFSSSNVVTNINGWSYVSQNDDEQEMVNYMAATGPLSVCVYAEPWQTYQSGILTASQCQGQIDHCVQATGYNLGGSTPYWIVRNSWGSDWGINGFIWLQYGQDTCSIGDVATTVTI